MAETSNNKKRELEDDDVEDDITEYKRLMKKKQLNLQRTDCPFLDTVNRNLLDFDFQKICSVSLSTLNVYCCLVCGKFFQGKSPESHANLHCLQSDHHVFINLSTSKIYCLPDDYEVIDPSLDDIKYLLNPIYHHQKIKELDTNQTYSRALNGTQYLPGFVGLNNIKNNSYFNVIIQMLSKIPTLRNHLIDSDGEFYRLLKISSSVNPYPLSSTLSELFRKIWNPRNFKSQVSPHELLQVVQNISKRKFKVGENSDPLEFLQWILNTCHQELGGTKSLTSSIIYQSFAGEIEVTTKKPIEEEKDQEEESNDTKKKKLESANREYKTSKVKNPFLVLSLELPPTPVFKDDKEKSILPQIPLYNLLEKYDGRENTNPATGEIKIYRLVKLPDYLVLVVKRFSKNNFFLEKESTIVNFPLYQLDLSDYLPQNSSSPNSKYNLHSVIKHEGEPDSGNFSIYIHHKSTEKWFEFQDLVVTETMTQLVSISECYLLVYEKIKQR